MAQYLARMQCSAGAEGSTGVSSLVEGEKPRCGALEWWGWWVRGGEELSLAYV